MRGQPSVTGNYHSTAPTPAPPFGARKVLSPLPAMDSPFSSLFHAYANDEAALAAEDAIYATLVADGILFTDPGIACSDLLYGDGGAHPGDTTAWNRISLGEVAGCSAPSLFGDTGDVFFGGRGAGSICADIVQGRLADRWFVGAIALLAQHWPARTRFVTRLSRRDTVASGCIRCDSTSPQAAFSTFTSTTALLATVAGARCTRAAAL